MKRARRYATAIALLAPMVALAAPGVEIYGTIDTGLAYVMNSANDSRSYSGGTKFGLGYGMESGNRFGLRGREDLGGGYEANFVLENGFDPGNGSMGQSGRLFGRQAWLGVQNSSLGYLRFGRQYNFGYDYISKLTPFGPGDFTRAGLGAAIGNAKPERLSNTIKIETAEIDGFKLGVGYSFATELGAYYASGIEVLVDQSGKAATGYNFPTVDNLRSFTSGAAYRSGALYLTATLDVYMPNVSVANGEYSNITAWVVGGSYQFPGVRTSVAYSQTRNGWMNAMQTQSVAPDGEKLLYNPTSFNKLSGIMVFDDSIAVNAVMMGVFVDIGKSDILFGSFQATSPTASMNNALGSYVSPQQSYSIGYTHELTKRTGVYAFASYATNYSMVPGLNTTMVGAGVRHRF